MLLKNSAQNLPASGQTNIDQGQAVRIQLFKIRLHFSNEFLLKTAKLWKLARVTPEQLP